jgi:hypothetical protein
MIDHQLLAQIQSVLPRVRPTMEQETSDRTLLQDALLDSLGQDFVSKRAMHDGNGIDWFCLLGSILSLS